MARLAKRKAVTQFIAKLWIVAPVLYVVRVHMPVFVMGALLASVPVASLHGRSPLYIPAIPGLKLVRTATLPARVFVSSHFASDGGPYSRPVFSGVRAAQYLGATLGNRLRAVQRGDVLRRALPAASTVPLDVSVWSSFGVASQCSTSAGAGSSGRQRFRVGAMSQIDVVAVDKSNGVSSDVAESAVCILGDRGQLTASALTEHQDILPPERAA